MSDKIIAMIPARIGSTRLKFKNLALVNKKPLIYYSINASIKSNIFDKIIINSDDNVFKKIANRYKVGFYNRPKKLGGNNIKSDDVVYDFLKSYKCDVLVWVNPIAPLQDPKDINKIVKDFLKSNSNSLYTVVDRKVHALYQNKILNFKKDIKFQQTQSLKPITEMVYTLMMWKRKEFIKNYSKFGNAFLKGKIKYYKVDTLNSFIVKNANDLFIVDTIIKSLNSKNKVKYDRILKK